MNVNVIPIDLVINGSLMKLYCSVQQRHSRITISAIKIVGYLLSRILQSFPSSLHLYCGNIDKLDWLHNTRRYFHIWRCFMLIVMSLYTY